MPSVEFRIPISPDRGMYSNVRLAALSLARLGPPYSTARISVSVGDCAAYEEVVAETPWAREFPIEWRMASHHAFETNPYPASGNDRYSEGPRADVVVLCDADLCVVHRFDALLDALRARGPAVAGLQAHYSPFNDRDPGANDATWRRLLAAAGLERRSLDLGYSMVPDGSQGRAPAYFNYGFVAFNAAGLRRIAPLVTKFTEIANRFLTDEHAGHPGYQSQVGLSLAIAVAGVEVVQLDHSCNCANDDRVFSSGLGGVGEIKAIHYLRTEEFDRNTFLCEPEAHRRFIASPMRNLVSERLRDHVLGLPHPFLGEGRE